MRIATSTHTSAKAKSQMNSPEDSLLGMDIQQGQTQLGPNTGQMTMVQFLDKKEKRDI